MNTELANLLTSVWNKYPIFIVIVLGILLLYPFVKDILFTSGLIRDRNTIWFEKIYEEISYMSNNHITKFENMVTMMKIISDNQNSYLTNDQVNHFTNITFSYIREKLLRLFIEEYESKNNDYGRNVKSIFENTIQEVDRIYFQLPNTKGKVLDTKEKIETFYLINEDCGDTKSPYESILLILDDNENLKNKKNNITLLLNKLTQSWFTTLTSE